MKKSFFERVNLTSLDLIGYLPRKSANNPSIILCYHSIGSSSWRFTTKTADFEKQIEYITRNYEVVSLKKFMNQKPRYNHAVITFDDGYEDVAKNALPIMNKYKIPGAMFVIGDYKNVDRGQLDNNLKILDISGIKTLLKNGWEIGFHTGTHGDIGSMTPKQLQKEIIDAKRLFEKKAGIKVKYFAYPRGKYNTEIINAVKKAGFKASFTIKGGYVSFKNLHKISRMPIEGSFSEKQFKAFISNYGQIITKIFMEILQLKQTMKERIL